MRPRRARLASRCYRGSSAAAAATSATAAPLHSCCSCRCRVRSSKAGGSGGPTAATLRLAGFAAATASAVTLASDDLDADNTPSDVDRVAPRPLDAQAEGGTVTVALPGHSFTVVTMAA